jgi:hypothetical protein
MLAPDRGIAVRAKHQERGVIQLSHQELEQP